MVVHVSHFPSDGPAVWTVLCDSGLSSEVTYTIAADQTFTRSLSCSTISLSRDSVPVSFSSSADCWVNLRNPLQVGHNPVYMDSVVFAAFAVVFAFVSFRLASV